MPDPIGEVPAGYAVHRVGATWLVLDRALAPDLIQLRLADRDVRHELFDRAPRRGRGHVPSVEINSETSAMLRRYRHGGLFGSLTRALFLGPSRPLREVMVTARAEASGAPVPHVLCLVLWPVVGPFWSAIIGTREERTAHELLHEIQVSSEPRRKLAMARQVGDAIRKLHDAGVEHRDLQLRNILVTSREEIVIVDLDRAVFHRYGRVPPKSRARNLARLVRSIIKENLWGTKITRRDLAAFSGAYTHNNRELRHSLRRAIPAERLKLLWHQFTYRFR